MKKTFRMTRAFLWFFIACVMFFLVVQWHNAGALNLPSSQARVDVGNILVWVFPLFLPFLLSWKIVFAENFLIIRYPQNGAGLSQKKIGFKDILGIEIEDKKVLKMSFSVIRLHVKNIEKCFEITTALFFKRKQIRSLFEELSIKIKEQNKEKETFNKASV